MTSDQESYRFSGHDTFHCKEQWILKGAQVVENEESTAVFKEDRAIPLLGVGKNMVRSINHWLKAFGVLTKDDKISYLAKKIFLEDKLDPYLENDGSLWLLQYYLCKTNHSSIFQLIFSKYFSDKATLDFSEYQIFNYTNRFLAKKGLKEVAEKTFNSDFKVFIRTYVSPKKIEKTIEDDFNAPLLALSLVSDTGRKNALGQSIYRLNRSINETISCWIFGYCLLTEFESEKSITYDQIKKSVGTYLCLSNEGLEILIDELCAECDQFIYKDDAGVRQLQIKEGDESLIKKMLTNHYGIQQ